MIEGEWVDTDGHRDATERAERATRFAWTAITGLMWLFVLAAVGLSLLAVFVLAYVVSAVR
ncbi:hypothetical protein GCM10010420_11520 [Streptomyces glaucosporus]|uniref:Integral membrane protein n=1 Tax=Streptomyces glaucosporus TaxID=284044 RepID=A0ABN3HWS0_9ACTN